MAIDPLIETAKPVGTLQIQNQPPALLGLGRLSPVPVHHPLAEPQLGVLGVELQPFRARLQRLPASCPSSDERGRSGHIAYARSSRSAPSRPGCAPGIRAPLPLAALDGIEPMLNSTNGSSGRSSSSRSRILMLRSSLRASHDRVSVSCMPHDQVRPAHRNLQPIERRQDLLVNPIGPPRTPGSSGKSRT